MCRFSLLLVSPVSVLPASVPKPSTKIRQKLVSVSNISVSNISLNFDKNLLGRKIWGKKKFVRKARAHYILSFSSPTSFLLLLFHFPFVSTLLVSLFPNITFLSSLAYLAKYHL